MARLEGVGPVPASAHALDLRFPARPRSVAEARRRVTDWLRASLPDEHRMIGDVALAVSEACTNAVVHAYRGESGGRPEPSFDVVAARDGTIVHITVSDQGCGMAPRPDSAGLGLGLLLIDALTDAVAVGSPERSPGTVVAMRFSAAGAETRTPIRAAVPAIATPARSEGIACGVLRLRAHADVDCEPSSMAHATARADLGDADYRWLVDGLADGTVMMVCISVEVDVGRADGSHRTGSELLRGVYVETGPLPHVEMQVSREATAALPALWQQLDAEDVALPGEPHDGPFIHVVLSDRVRRAVRGGAGAVASLTAHDAMAKAVSARVLVH